MNYLAIDVGGTFIKYAVITENCSILEKDKTPTRQESLEVFIQSPEDQRALYDRRNRAQYAGNH